MSRVYVLVEGQTEQAFVREILAPALGPIGVYLSAVLVGEPGHKGGIRRFSIIERDISNLLKQDAEGYVSTLFDRYGLPNDWPGLNSSKQRDSLADALGKICEAMRGIMIEKMGPRFDRRRFLPYVQFHETEAFLFVAPDETAKLLGNPARAEDLRLVLQQHETCEHIDDGPNTAPSKRIEVWFPGYKKGKTVNAHLPRICARVGLETIRGACPLFHAWLAELESLASQQNGREVTAT